MIGQIILSLLARVLIRISSPFRLELEVKSCAYL
jgi:hypothetical protein